jgi:hypothetical protein
MPWEGAEAAAADGLLDLLCCIRVFQKPEVDGVSMYNATDNGELPGTYKWGFGAASRLWIKLRRQGRAQVERYISRALEGRGDHVQNAAQPVVLSLQLHHTEGYRS